ncbi:adenylate/guanylate cyclase domain-containing protein [Shinella sp.]|uniref:adenylate/guanylate cyclase domain-containing protein n=1 Tax=Shinella sp. TaxID=1870904 RepID=UPI0039E218FF
MAGRPYTRHLATIVSIDAVGFSRLMGIDAETAVATFEERRDTIFESCAAFGGRTFGDAGDSIMAEFGSPVDALNATLDFQKRIAALNASASADMRMRFRTGINTGDVIVRDDRLYGDDINIAARLQEFAPAGGLAVSGTTWHHVRDKTSTEFADMGELTLKNIALPVRVFLAGHDRRADAGTVSPPIRPRPSGDGPPTIAVLPFRSENAGQDIGYIAEGMAEDIIHGLCNIRWLSVIANGSSFQFRDETLDTRLIGNTLGARYLVGGSMLHHADRIRVAASLTDTSTGRRMWSRHFERDMADVFTLRDQIGGEIVSALEKEVDRAEQVRTFQVPWESLATWQMVRRGRWHMSKRTRADTEAAFDFFMAAYKADPNASAVLNELAWWYFWRAWLRLGDSDDLGKVEEFARKALLMDSLDARPHAHLGVACIMRGLPQDAIRHLGEALHINPSFAFANSAMGSAHLLLGDARRAIPFLMEADRLSPFDLYGFHNLGELAAAHSLEQDWPAAIAAADRSLNLSPGYFYSRFLKVGALMKQRRHEEARRELAIFRTRHPDFSYQRIRWIPFADRGITDAFIANFELAERCPD